MRDGMTIGGLAKAAGVNVETIRYYQRRGLIAEPHKPPGGHRRYSQAVVGQLAFIRRAQQLGFSLAEVQSLLLLSDGRHGRESRLIAERKCATLDAHIAHLTKMRRKLQALVDQCKKSKGKKIDPLMPALRGED